MLKVNTIPVTFLRSFVISQKFQVNLPFTDVYSMNKNEKLKLHLKNASGGTNLKEGSLLSTSNAETRNTRVLIKAHEEFISFLTRIPYL